MDICACVAYGRPFLEALKMTSGIYIWDIETSLTYNFKWQKTKGSNEWQYFPCFNKILATRFNGGVII